METPTLRATILNGQSNETLANSRAEIHAMGLWTVPFATGLVFLGCCTNVVFLELIIRYKNKDVPVFKMILVFPAREEPGAGTIITFFQFLFVALEGFVLVSKFGQTSPQIPIGSYMKLVCLYFTVSVVNNLAFYFDIPLPLHMIFRAVSLRSDYDFTRATFSRWW